MTFRLTDSDCLRDVNGRVKWSPRPNERVRWRQRAGEYIGRITAVRHDANTLSLVVLDYTPDDPTTTGLSAFHVRAGAKLSIDMGVVRPFHYQGPLRDLEIVRDVPSG